MSIYWKQSLVIGGIYWLISLLLQLSGYWPLALTDLVISFLLLLFLIPMNKLVPIKKIDNLINRRPVITTMLASVGWLPYFSALLALIASIAAIAMRADINQENLAMIMKVVVTVSLARKYVAVVVVFVVLIAVLVYGKSIAGQLNDHYKLETKEAKPTKKENAKVEEVKATKAEVKVEPKKPIVKKVVKKSAVKKAELKKTVAKKEVKPVVKQAEAKPEKKAVVKPAEPKSESKTVKKVAAKTSVSKVKKATAVIAKKTKTEPKDTVKVAKKAVKKTVKKTAKKAVK